MTPCRMLKFGLPLPRVNFTVSGEPTGVSWEEYTVTSRMSLEFTISWMLCRVSKWNTLLYISGMTFLKRNDAILASPRPSSSAPYPATRAALSSPVIPSNMWSSIISGSLSGLPGYKKERAWCAYPR